MKKNSQTLICIGILIYFSMLVLISYANIKINTIIEAILELMTIPMILLTVFLLFINTKRWMEDKFSIKSNSVLPIVLLFFSISIMIFATILNI